MTAERPEFDLSLTPEASHEKELDRLAESRRTAEYRLGTRLLELLDTSLDTSVGPVTQKDLDEIMRIRQQVAERRLAELAALLERREMTAELAARRTAAAAVLADFRRESEAGPASLTPAIAAAWAHRLATSLTWLLEQLDRECRP